jgi:hypothetical protein
MNEKPQITRRAFLKRSAIATLGTLLASGWMLACGKKDEDKPDTEPPTPQENPELAAMQMLWETSPLAMSAARQDALRKIQACIDKCNGSYFKGYANSTEGAAAEGLENIDPLLKFYHNAFDRVLNGLKNDEVPAGTAAIWMLYNMGYVIKTPSSCFAIDITHLYAEQLAPYLDFLCVSHNHSDHYSQRLIQKMLALGKPVLSNYITHGTNYSYLSTAPANYAIGSCTIRTGIADHNSTLKNFVTLFRIACGADAGGLSLLHVGDSSYSPSQHVSVEGAVNLLIPRYGPNPLSENNILGSGAGQLQPDYALLAHIAELAHEGVDGSRWTLDQALERASKINCAETHVPFWGEKLVWANNMLS